ncbi:hypothetical protein DFH09DRAFT_1245005 [Mycena vulgaris]|nr:hypothetical protein DFH09DRAFT_1245005 [Mycena vulgaris]
MLVVHHLNNSRQRILLQVTPLGKSPVITDADVTLAESTAIIEYLIKKYSVDGALAAPSSGPEYVNNLYCRSADALEPITHFAGASLMPLLVQRLIFTSSPRSMPEDIRPTAIALFGQVQKQRIDPQIEKYAAFVEKHLEKVEWFAGGSGLTAADFAVSFPLEGLALLKMAGPNA